MTPSHLGVKNLDGLISRLAKALLTMVLAALAVPAAAQDITAYEGARLITGDGRVLENATLVVQGERIAGGAVRRR